MHKENGETVYDEIIVGYLPESCNPHIEFDEEKKKNFVEVDGYIVEKYTKAADILRREGKCQVSVEMAVNEMNYYAQTRILNITDFIFTGVTILGRFEDGTEVQAGMAGSNITIRDSEVSFADTQIKLEELSRQVAEIQHSLSIKNSEKGGTESLMKFDELLKKYNKTAEEVTFETEGLSDEELEAKFAEVFGEAPMEGEGGELLHLIVGVLQNISGAVADLHPSAIDSDGDIAHWACLPGQCIYGFEIAPYRGILVHVVTHILAFVHVDCDIAGRHRRGVIAPVAGQCRRHAFEIDFLQVWAAQIRIVVFRIIKNSSKHQLREL
jgi:hypothetical protein